MPSTVNWSSECDRAFIRLKEILCSDPVLQAPNFDKVFILQTDASEEGLGAVLSQADHKGQERQVACISRKLLPREKMYSTIEKEALAIKWAMEKLKVYLLTVSSWCKLITRHCSLWNVTPTTRGLRAGAWPCSPSGFQSAIARDGAIRMRIP